MHDDLLELTLHAVIYTCTGWKKGPCLGWSIADDGRLASKKTSDIDLEVLHSDGPLLKSGSSVLFKVMYADGVVLLSLV